MDDGIRVEIVEGLAEDALVVVAGQALVGPGAPVRAVLRSNSS
jgi:hypothetical protein